MPERNFNKLYWFTFILVFLVVCLRAFFIPFAVDESVTFFAFAQAGKILPYESMATTNNHFLNSSLVCFIYNYFGSHRFLLRLPNVIAFILFGIGLFRNFRYFKTVAAKIIVSALFLFAFNFLDFFELTRGYGLSLGFMMLGLSFLMNFFESARLKYFLYFSICWQLALASNLSLLPILSILLVYTLFFIALNFRKTSVRKFFYLPSLLIFCGNIYLLKLWVNVGLYYKGLAALDYGIGENYWMSFKTLMEVTLNSGALWLQIVFAIAFLAMFFYFLKDYFSSREKLNGLFKPEYFFIISFFGIVLAFYLQRQLLDVFYPKGRTGLFFYLFFVLALGFTIDRKKSVLNSILSYSTASVLFCLFIIRCNFSDFTSLVYQTIPDSFYKRLLSESKGEGPFTIGGDLISEENFVFTNYSHHSALNPISTYAEMQMHCDYFITHRWHKYYYDNYYDEIAFHPAWDLVLLKRKEPIRHQLLAERKEKMEIKGSEGFYTFIWLPDTVLSSHDPIETEVEIFFRKVPKAFNGCIILTYKNARGEIAEYKKIVLSRLEEDLSGTVKRVKLNTSTISDTIRGLNVHIWNLDAKPIDIVLNYASLYQLKGRGVDFKVPGSFYYAMIPYMKEANY
jgi:hypothetical protein